MRANNQTRVAPRLEKPRTAALPACAPRTEKLLHDAPAGLGLQPDFAKSRLILVHVLLQHVQKSLGLLRADVNPLEILNRNLVRSCLIHTPEQKQEIPQIHANLDAVCIVLAIFRRIGELDLRSGRLRHSYRVPSQIAAKAAAETVDTESHKASHIKKA